MGNSTGLRVLVVDDIEEMRILIRRALSACGYEVDLAATLAEARGLDPGGYDAVLVDAHLGREQGIDLVQELLAADPGAVSRCLVMTGGTADELPGSVAFLAKPFQLGELLDAVRALHQPAPSNPGHSRSTGAHQPQIIARDVSAPTQDDARVPTQESVLPGPNQPAADDPRACQLLRLTRRLRASERHELVDFLHDGPIQDLTAVTLELHMIARSMQRTEHFEAVLKQLNAAAGSLRWLVDGPWPFLEPETSLTAALQQRTAWLLAKPVTVDADDHAAGLGTAEVPAIVDVVELMLLGIVTGNPPAQAHVTLRADEHALEIELTLTSAAGQDHAIGDPALAQAALDGLAAALGADAHGKFSGQDWRAHIVLGRQPAQVLEQSGLRPQ